MTLGSREQLAREARVSGLRDFTTPSLEAVEQRRSQLWTVAFVVMGCLAAGLVALTIGGPDLLGGRTIVRLPAFRIGLVLLIVSTAVYLLEKEVHLRRLTRLLIDERVLTAALSNRLKELAALSTVGKAVNSVLSLDEVMNIILASSLELLGGESGSIMLAEGHDELRAVCVRGTDVARDTRIALGEGIVGRVAADREPLLVTGGRDGDEGATTGAHSGMCVPLVNRGELLGVLNVSATHERLFSEYDLRSLTLFAEHAAVAIVNARLYEVERAHVAELLEVDRLKSEFVATVSHELRTPLTSILGSVQTLQRHELDAQQVDEFLQVIERQGQRLLHLIEEILVARRAESGLWLQAQSVDLSRAVSDLAQMMVAAGRPVEVRARAGALVHADPEAVDQIMFNLVDNAFTHGAGPVEVVVEGDAGPDGNAVRLTVLDRGPGVRPDRVEQIFERFTRFGGHDAPGIGLGLYLVRTLAEAQGGSVSVSDRPGGGAAFSVTLPAAMRTTASEVSSV